METDLLYVDPFYYVCGGIVLLAVLSLGYLILRGLIEIFGDLWFQIRYGWVVPKTTPEDERVARTGGWLNMPNNPNNPNNPRH